MLNKSAFRKSLWGGLSRTVGVGLGVGAGSALKQLAGAVLDGWVPAVLMAIASLILIVFAEYEREITPDDSSEQLNSCRKDNKN